MKKIAESSKTTKWPSYILLICLLLLNKDAFSQDFNAQNNLKQSNLLSPKDLLNSSSKNQSDKTILDVEILKNIQSNEEFDSDSQNNINETQPLSYSLPPCGKELASPFDGATIYQYDKSALGLRQPILFIHGGGGEHQELFRWDKLLPYLEANPKFDKKYKVFLLRYDTKLTLGKTMPDITKKFIDLYYDCDKKPIRIVALSMGGNVSQRLIANKTCDHMIDQIFAMGSPFHGSPLFCSDWFAYSLQKRHHFAPAKIIDDIEYKGYFHYHKNYQKDLRWDDEDNSMPIKSAFHADLPLCKNESLGSQDVNYKLRKIDDEDSVNKKKFITYAGYLVNPYIIAPDKKKGLGAKIKTSLYQIKTFWLAQSGKELAALRLLNLEIAQTVVKNSKGDKLAPNVYEFGLNDGITPVSSAIFLPKHALKIYKLDDESQLKDVSSVTDVKIARVFRNVNHVTFVDGGAKNADTYLVDELHPEEPKQTIFNWILNELLNS